MHLPPQSPILPSLQPCHLLASLPSTAAPAEAAILRLAEDSAAGPGPGSRREASSSSSFDLLSATEWPGVAEGDVLLAPAQCRSIWRQFMSDSTFAVQQVGGQGVGKVRQDARACTRVARRPAPRLVFLVPVLQQAATTTPPPPRRPHPRRRWRRRKPTAQRRTGCRRCGPSQR